MPLNLLITSHLIVTGKTWGRYLAATLWYCPHFGFGAQKLQNPSDLMQGPHVEFSAISIPEIRVYMRRLAPGPGFWMDWPWGMHWHDGPHGGYYACPIDDTHTYTDISFSLRCYAESCRRQKLNKIPPGLRERACFAYYVLFLCYIFMSCRPADIASRSVLSYPIRLKLTTTSMVP